jgi:hypothetical protein
LCAVLCLGAGCRDSQPPPDDENRRAGVLPAGLFLAAPPATPRDVREVKRDPRDGEAVVIRGRIGGAKHPFVPGRAVFLLSDLSMQPCSANPEDRCPTPWDYCCEPPDRIASRTIAVEVVDAGGRPLAVGLEGVGSLRPSAAVVVRGRVSVGPTKTAVIRAEGIHVGAGSEAASGSP